MSRSYSLSVLRLGHSPSLGMTVSFLSPQAAPLHGKEVGFGEFGGGSLRGHDHDGKQSGRGHVAGDGLRSVVIEGENHLAGGSGGHLDLVPVGIHGVGGAADS